MAFCECGCGQPTKIATQTRTEAGWIKGQPRRFIKGHSNRFRINKIERICETCGEKFLVRPDNVENGTGRFCSRSCYASSRVGPLNSCWRGGVVDWGGDNAYRAIYKPDHPKAVGNYVAEHVLVAEAALGKYLPSGAVVHHVNGDKKHNANTNLVVCENSGYHLFLHSRINSLRRKA